MTKYFDCSIRYRKTNEQGVQKIVTESYLVDSLTFTEAESKITAEMQQLLGEEFKITNIRSTNYSEVHPQEGADFWFKSKITLLSFDEEHGREKKSNMYILVQANDTKEAYDRTVEIMKGIMGDWSIPSVSLTSIVDFFPYVSGE